LFGSELLYRRGKLVNAVPHDRKIKRDRFNLQSEVSRRYRRDAGRLTVEGCRL
jgi:hypothetical protein